MDRTVTPSARGAWKQGPVDQATAAIIPRASLPPLARGVLMPRQPRRHTIAQENTAQEHEHKVVEILVCPGDSPLRRDAWVCACGAQRLVDLEGKPAGAWSVWKPIP